MTEEQKAKWIGKYCSFIKSKHAVEFENNPNRLLAAENDWLLKGDIVDVKEANPVGRIPTFICTVRGRRSGKTLTVNSTLQYLRFIEDDT